LIGFAIIHTNQKPALSFGHYFCLAALHENRYDARSVAQHNEHLRAGSGQQASNTPGKSNAQKLVVIKSNSIHIVWCDTSKGTKNRDLYYSSSN
jgi:hypothetical protein